MVTLKSTVYSDEKTMNNSISSLYCSRVILNNDLCLPLTRSSTIWVKHWTDKYNFKKWFYQYGNTDKNNYCFAVHSLNTLVLKSYFSQQIF